MESLKILIVEDNFFSAENMMEQLRQFGYAEVFHAGDFESACALIDEQKPDLAILDIHLENSIGDGIQIGEYIRSHLQIPIIFLTALSDKETLNRAKSIGPSNYIIKPYKANQLEIAIDIALSNFSENQVADLESSKKEIIPKDFFFNYSDNSFFLKHKHRYVRVLIPNILYVKAGGASVEVITKTSKYVISANLKSFINQVTHQSLVKVHRSYVANLNLVDAFDTSSLVFTKAGKELKIPYTNQEVILKKFKKVKAD